MERDARGARHPPVSVGAEDGAGQTNPPTSSVFATTRATGIICDRASGELRFYPRNTRPRDYGFGARKYVDWAITLAGTVAGVGREILASPTPLKLRRVKLAK